MTKAAKRPLSNSPGAIRVRRHRLRRDQGEMVVPVLVKERHIDILERAGHLDVRIEKDAPVTAVREAIADLLDTVRPSNK